MWGVEDDERDIPPALTLVTVTRVVTASDSLRRSSIDTLKTCIRTTCSHSQILGPLVRSPVNVVIQPHSLPTLLYPICSFLLAYSTHLAGSAASSCQQHVDTGRRVRMQSIPCSRHFSMPDIPIFYLGSNWIPIIRISECVDVSWR